MNSKEKDQNLLNQRLVSLKSYTREIFLEDEKNCIKHTLHKKYQTVFILQNKNFHKINKNVLYDTNKMKKKCRSVTEAKDMDLSPGNQTLRPLRNGC